MATKCNGDQDMRDGTGQAHRFLPALDATRVLLDERKPEDLLVFAKHYADLIRFYDVDQPVDWAIGDVQANDPNSPGPVINGPTKEVEVPPKYTTWKEFFYQDIAVVIASMTQYKSQLGPLKQEYDDLRKKVEKQPNLDNFQQLFTSIIAHLQRLGRWYDWSIAEHPLREELEIKINSSLRPVLENLIAYDKGTVALDATQANDDDDLIDFDPTRYALFKPKPWNINVNSIKKVKTIYVGTTDAQRIVHAALFVDDLFLAVLKVYKELTDRSEYYFSQAIENYPEHQPHMGLFIAFIQLFTHAQEELNTIANRHLEFYYRDVLRLKERPAQPDSVYLLYELAKEVVAYDLKAGTPVFAGKDATGRDLVYKTEKELVINKAKVAELKTLFLDSVVKPLAKGAVTENDYEIRKIYAAPVSNSADGLGAKFKVAESAWPAFGYFKDDEEKTGIETEIGFAIASPQLFLAEGDRKITITLNAGPEANFLTPLDQALEIQLSSSKEWMKITLTKGDLSFGIVENKILINIPRSAQPIVAYNPEIHGGSYVTEYPIMKCLLKDSSKYDALRNILIGEILMSVEVTGVKALILANDTAPIDPTKSFHPFSTFPKPGSKFTIGSKEVFAKQLSTISLAFKRKVNGLGFELLKEQELGSTLKVNLELFHDRNWQFAHVPGDEDGLDFFNEDGLSHIKHLSHFPRNIHPDAEFGLDGSFGFMRLNLHAHFDEDEDLPDERFYDKFFRLPLDQRFNVYQLLELLLETNELTIDYTSTQNFEIGIDQFFHVFPFGATEIYFDNFSVGVTEGLSGDRVKKFLLYDEHHDNLVVNTQYLLPQFKFGIDNTIWNKLLKSNEGTPEPKRDYFGVNQYQSLIQQQGNLFIGIEDLDVPQNLSLLFKFADGTADDNDLDPPNINWSYLVNNEWRPLPPENIVSDSTYGLQTSGIVLMDFPEEASKNNTILTTGLHWLCASVDHYGNRMPRLIDVIAQANQALFFDQGNDHEHYRNPLPAETISKLVTKVPEIKLVGQPFESFEGKMREEGKVFYTRASERLRHKNRAITPWDYEHLVLEHFPGIYKVRAFTHTDPECICRHEKNKNAACCCGQIAPGHVMIVPISNLRNKNAVDILKPRTSRRTLLQIEAYLKKLTSPFVHVHAKNPVFEEIKTSFRVKFHTGTDKGWYLKQLNEDLIKFLTPWAFDETKDVVFGSKVYASDVINFIEELKYVDYITCFRMIHIVDGCCEDDSLPDLTCFEISNINNKTDKESTRLETEIEASSTRAILTSVKKHCIELIIDPPVEDDCHCHEVIIT